MGVSYINYSEILIDKHVRILLAFSEEILFRGSLFELLENPLLT